MFYSSGSNIRWFPFVSWKGNCMSSQRETSHNRLQLCICVCSIQRLPHDTSLQNLCGQRSFSWFLFCQSMLIFQLFLFGSCKKRRFIVLSLRVSRDVSPQTSHFSQPGGLPFPTAFKKQLQYAPQRFCSTGLFTLHLTLGYHLVSLGLRALINPR